MDGDGISAVEVWVSDRNVVESEIEVRIVGDDNGHGGEESGKASVGLEEEKIGERESLGDDMVREEKRVHGWVVIGDEIAAVLRDKEGGAHREHQWVGQREDGHPTGKVAGPDQGVDNVAELLRRRRWHCRRRWLRDCRE